MHHPYIALALSFGKRFSWAAFGASLATAVLATRPAHVPIQPAVLPVKVVATAFVPPPERPPPVVPALPAAPYVEPPRRALGAADAHACSRAWVEGGVHRSGYGVTYLTRSAVDHALEDQATLHHSTRVVPELVDGHVAGIKVFGVRPGTWLQRLGFVNGDRVDSIDGYDLMTPDHALEAYAKLRSHDDYHVAITRFGAKMTLVFRVC